MVPTHDLLHWRQECNTVAITPQMRILFLWYLLIWVCGETGVHIRPRLQSVQIIIDRCKMQGIRFQSMKIGELIAIAEKKKDEVVSMQSFSKQWVFTIWLISTVIAYQYKNRTFNWLNLSTWPSLFHDIDLHIDWPVWKPCIDWYYWSIHGFWTGRALRPLDKSLHWSRVRTVDYF